MSDINEMLSAVIEEKISKMFDEKFKDKIASLEKRVEILESNKPKENDLPHTRTNVPIKIILNGISYNRPYA